MEPHEPRLAPPVVASIVTFQLITLALGHGLLPYGVMLVVYGASLPVGPLVALILLMGPAALVAALKAASPAKQCLLYCGMGLLCLKWLFAVYISIRASGEDGFIAVLTGIPFLASTCWLCARTKKYFKENGSASLAAGA